MMSNLDEVPRLYLTLHDCQNNQKLRSFRIPYVRAEDFGSVFFCCSHDDCQVMFTNVFRIQRWS